jgi:NAD(P)-dependent dehydrogenase (short-subunit alcohol dehydrogenase family)
VIPPSEHDEQRVAIITGASQGIGAGLAKAYRERGYAVIATARSIGPSEDPGIVTIGGDIVDPDTAQRVVDEAVERFSRIDILINNAGIYIGKPFTEYTLQDFNALIAVNLAGFFHMTTRTIRQMLDQGRGHVINVSTTLVEHVDSSRPAALQTLTKGGLVAVTRSLAVEYASRGLRINAVSLGVIKTPLTRRELLHGDGRAAPHRPSWRNRGCSRWGALSRVGALRDRGDLAHRRRPKRRTLTVGLSSRSDTPSRSSEREIVTEVWRTRGGDRAATGKPPLVRLK